MSRVGELDALLLAAGLSSRMGETNKLLLDFNGQPLVRHMTETLLRVGFRTVLVVTGHQAEPVSAALDGLAVSTSINSDFAAGQQTSVVHGLHVLSEFGTKSAGVMICLADMPWLDTTDYRFLANAFFEHGGNRITLPEFAGERGNPIIVPRRHLTEASAGGLNTGCRRLIEKRPDEVDRIAVNSAAFIRDVDTPPDYVEALRLANPGAPCCG